MARRLSSPQLSKVVSSLNDIARPLKRCCMFWLDGGDLCEVGLATEVPGDSETRSFRVAIARQMALSVMCVPSPGFDWSFSLRVRPLASRLVGDVAVATYVTQMRRMFNVICRTVRTYVVVVLLLLCYGSECRRPSRSKPATALQLASLRVFPPTVCFLSKSKSCCSPCRSCIA
ncbi:unnamed protein product [Soboliphyme baturini]|uniref:Secreted protein n=1 Tax=Soboliphyme baturini TaxID=241478 RepID=A0A183IVS1_9BILA|nr:unnamed protein product [Soboliphyme baturini]